MNKVYEEEKKIPILCKLNIHKWYYIHTFGQNRRLCTRNGCEAKQFDKNGTWVDVDSFAFGSYNK
jgi:hypothetical protein